MLKKLVIITCCIFLVACGKEKEEKEAYQHIHDTVHTDWNNYVPLNELVTAAQECKEYPDITGCTKLDNQLYDISASFETCKQFTESTLCNAVIKRINDHPIKNILPEAEALSMPDDPFYFNLPTGYLNANSSFAGYRYEMFNWWVQKYQSFLDTIICATTIILVLWVLLMVYRKEKVNQAEIERKKIYREQEAVEQKIRDDRQRLREAEIAAKQKADAEIIAEQKRLREIEQAEIALQIEAEKQKSDEAAAHEAADKRQIEEIMKAAVKKFQKKK